MQQIYIEANNAYIDLETIPNDERLGTVEYLVQLLCEMKLPYEIVDEGCGVFKVNLYPDDFLDKNLSEKLKNFDISYQNYPIMFDLNDHYKELKAFF